VGSNDVLSSFWNLAFSCCSYCDILYSHHSQTTTLHNSDSLSEYIARTQLLLAGVREECAHDTILWLHVSAVVQNSATVWPVHKIIYSTTYILYRTVYTVCTFLHFFSLNIMTSNS
jgi:hypothetical protein